MEGALFKSSPHCASLKDAGPDYSLCVYNNMIAPPKMEGFRSFVHSVIHPLIMMTTRDLVAVEGLL